jgi:hypothetical protein
MITDKRKRALLEKHRDINTDYDWWRTTYQEFLTELEGVGIAVDIENYKDAAGGKRRRHAIFFSGFYSQGDGACFSGRIDDEVKFLAAHKEAFAATPELTYATTYPWYESIRVSWVCGLNQYVHANTLGFSFDINIHEEESCNLAEAAQQAIYAAFDQPMFIGIVEAIVKDYCNQLYATLRVEHDHLTSDEVVWGSIVANEFDTPTEEEEDHAEQ